MGALLEVYDELHGINSILVESPEFNPHLINPDVINEIERKLYTSKCITSLAAEHLSCSIFYINQAMSSEGREMSLENIEDFRGELFQVDRRDLIELE